MYLPEGMWYLPADTQLAMLGYFHCNSPLCHPVQFNLILLCLTQTLCLLCWLLTYSNTRHQESSSHQSRQPNTSIRFCCLLFKTLIPISEPLRFCWVFFFSFISLQQNTIDVSKCNAHFHGHGITKGHNSGFSVSQTVHLRIHS